MNGLNLINDGHPFWGIIMVSLPFTPVAIVGLAPLTIAFFKAADVAGKFYNIPKDYCGSRVGLLFGFLFGCVVLGLGAGLSLALYILGVVLCTAGYILFVLGSGCIKAARPDIESLDRKDKVLGCIKPKHVNKYTPVLRTAEVASESYPQSILGE